MKRILQFGMFTGWTLAIVCIVTLAACSSASCKTIYVATDGNDGAPGTSQSPLLTVQAALQTAAPGDTVFVKKGVFRGRLTFPRDGVKDKPIVLTGEPGTIIDGGTVITGWEKVNGEGGNIYRAPFAGPEPFNLTSNNEYLLRIREEFVERRGMATLKNGCTAMLSWDNRDKSKPYPSWAGVTAFWCVMKNYVYIGYADPKANPANAEITTSPDERNSGSTINIDGRKFVTVRGLTIRNAYHAVYVCNNSSDCIIEDNKLIGGRHTVEITGGSSRIKVRKNEITLGYKYNLDPDNEFHWAIWAAFKTLSDWDRVCVNLDTVGSDNEVSENHLYQNFDGVQNEGSSVRLMVRGNIIEDMADDGLEPTGDETDARWCDNIVRRCNIAYRHKCPTSGPMYVYNNRFYSRSGTAHSENVGIYWFGGSTATAYVYHNNIATAVGATFGSTDREVGLANTWLVNNIFSCDGSVFQDMTGNWTKPPHVDCNYIGGDRSEKLKWWGDGNKVVKNGEIWKLVTEPDYQLTSNSPARGIGIDISKPWSVDGTAHPALPGYAPGYFKGTRPDVGSFQYGSRIVE